MSRAIKAVEFLAAGIAGLGIVTILTLTLADVLSRQFAESSLVSAYEFSEVILAAVAFCGAALAHADGVHVTTNIITSRLSGSAQRWVSLAARVAAAIMLAALACYAIQVAMSSLDVREARIGLADVPVWPAKIAIAVGFVSYLLVVVAKPKDAGDSALEVSL